MSIFAVFYTLCYWEKNCQYKVSRVPFLFKYFTLNEGWLTITPIQSLYLCLICFNCDNTDICLERSWPASWPLINMKEWSWLNSIGTVFKQQINSFSRFRSRGREHYPVKNRGRELYPAKSRWENRFEDPAVRMFLPGMNMTMLLLCLVEIFITVTIFSVPVILPYPPVISVSQNTQDMLLTLVRRMEVILQFMTGYLHPLQDSAQVTIF